MIHTACKVKHIALHTMPIRKWYAMSESERLAYLRKYGYAKKL